MAITGNTSYTTSSLTAFSIETVLRRNFKQQWMTKSPLLGRIFDNKTNVNKSAMSSGKTGNIMILPVVLGDSAIPARGVTRAGQLTPATAAVSDGFTQAAYNYAAYEGFVLDTQTDKRTNNNMRGNFLEAKIQQEIDSMIKLISTDVCSANIDANNAMLGIQQVCSTSNVVGGINQSTDTVWASNLFSSYGNFNLDLIDAGGTAVRANEGKTDLILISRSSTNDLYQKFLASLGSAQRITSDSTTAKFGWDSIIYAGADVVLDPYLTAGVIVGLDTSDWYYNGDEMPRQLPTQRLGLTTVDETAFSLIGALGCISPRTQWRATGVS